MNSAAVLPGFGPTPTTIAVSGMPATIVDSKD